MKKFIVCSLVILLAFSFAACGNGGATDPELIGTWYVDHTESHTSEESLNLTFKHVSEIVYFPGAKMEFKTNGECTLNNEVVSYKITGDGKFETLNAQNQRTEVSYTIESDTLTMGMYSDKYIVVLSKNPVPQNDSDKGDAVQENTTPNIIAPKMEEEATQTHKEKITA